MIVPPRRSDDYPDRDSDCQSALEAEFQSIMSRATAAGWAEGEVEFALLCLAISEIRRRQCNEETDEAIRRALRNVEGH
ncbi:hypothetical protein [Nitratireductor thuwali]|uniref:DUF982 domain-containing protein n=1 Tax=Nitratireductor thuwali TaxID=2267699 RepID=A0ABY5MRJ4_9HYPH|nr:hypothetical protein NTH_03987 [Nitratireductor thuwali]